MKKVYIATCSGGKDSTAMLLTLLNQGRPVDYVLYNHTGAEYPEIMAVIEQIKSILPPSIPFIQTEPGHTLKEYMTTFRRPRGKYAGRPYFWPTFKCRWCLWPLKQKPTNKFLRQFRHTHEVVLYTGFNVDESHRAERADASRSFISQPYSYIFPLIGQGYGPRECLDICYAHGITWDGLYEHISRVSCYLCPLQGMNTFAFLIYERPHMWQEIKSIEASLKEHYPDMWRFKIDLSTDDIEERVRRR